MRKIIIIATILICLCLLPINAFAQNYGKVGSDTNFNGDVNVPTGYSYYINEVEMVKLNKYDATEAPGVTNDTDEGYKVGSNWYDVTNDKAYICLDNTDGAAVWTETTSQGSGETNTASNIGDEVEIFSEKDGVDLELRTLKADSNKILITTTPEGGEIDAGLAAIDRDGVSGTWTMVEKENPANQSGKITSVEIWADSELSNCEVATFFVVSGNNLSTRDTQTIGTVTAGSKQTFTVDLDVETGDYLGIYFTAGGLEKDAVAHEAGYLWYDTTDKIPCTNQLFGLSDELQISLYGTGLTSTLDYIRFDVEEENIKLDDLGAPDDNADNDASTSAHGLMPKLPFSGDLLSITTVTFAADADTTLYTVPAGKRCVLTHAIVVAADDAGATTTISIGANGAETDFIPANTLSNLDAQYDSVILQPVPNVIPLKNKSYAAATVIEAQVASQSGAAGNTVYLFGILY